MPSDSHFLKKFITASIMVYPAITQGAYSFLMLVV